MPSVKVITETEIDREVTGSFPIILDKKAKFPVTKVTGVRRELGRTITYESWVNTGVLHVGRIKREEQRIEEWHKKAVLC
jgi:hypothetical protein